MSNGFAAIDSDHLAIEFFLQNKVELVTSEKMKTYALELHGRLFWASTFKYDQQTWHSDKAADLKGDGKTMLVIPKGAKFHVVGTRQAESRDAPLTIVLRHADMFVAIDDTPKFVRLFERKGIDDLESRWLSFKYSIGAAIRELSEGEGIF